MQALEDLQHNNPNADAEAMRFAISVSELQPDTGTPTAGLWYCSRAPTCLRHQQPQLQRPKQLASGSP
jgi:hypothetical protein